MARLRDAVELLIQERTKHGNLMSYMMARRHDGITLRGISSELYDLTGLAISHESVRAWIEEG